MTLGDRLLLFHTHSGKRLIMYQACGAQKVSRNVKKSCSPNLDNVIDMIAHSHKQIEEQFAPILHLHLHGSAPLESLATPDDQSKVMSAESRFCVWRVLIRIPSWSQDHVDLDAGLKTLFPKSKALQFLQAILLGSAVDDGVSKYFTAHSSEVDCRFVRSATTIFLVLRVLQFPSVSALVVDQAWIVVTLVEEFEDTG
jgi:hypothetical protein